MSGKRGKGNHDPGGRGDDDGAAPSPPLFSPVELAEARSRTYHLLSCLYLHGLTEDTLPIVAAVPELARSLAQPFDPDQAAAAHQHLFGFNVFPYESIFLGTSGLLVGPANDALLRDYRQVGYDLLTASESADHAGHELGLLAFLSGAEADARQDGLTEVAERLARQQQRFLQDHLLRWLPPLAQAIEQHAQPFYTALARLTLAFVMDHAGSGSAEAKANLPPVPNLLEDEETSLRSFASYLLTPVYSGIYLGRDDIGRLAREHQLPRGFGERRQMLLNLLRSAAQYDSLEAVLNHLVELCARWAEGYSQMGGQSSAAQAWQRRAEETARLLARMRCQLGELAGQ